MRRATYVRCVRTVRRVPGEAPRIVAASPPFHSVPGHLGYTTGYTPDVGRRDCGFRNPRNHRRRVRLVCNRRHGQASAMNGHLPG
jgi:hypothetical protein